MQRGGGGYSSADWRVVDVVHLHAQEEEHAVKRGGDDYSSADRKVVGAKHLQSLEDTSGQQRSEEEAFTLLSIRE